MTEETAKATASATITTTTTTSSTETATAGTRQRKKRKWDQPAEGLISAVAGMPGFLPGLTAAGAFANFGTLPAAFPYVNYLSAVSTTAAQTAAVQSMVTGTVQQNAAAIVQKFNQDMASKGLLLQAKIQDELIAREITINDADPGVRYKLTKRQTQEEIQMKTGAVVITRGRYRPPNGPGEVEKPLYLHISAGINLKDTADRIRAVDQAAAMVEEMLKQGQQAQVPLRSTPSGASTNGYVSLPLAVNVFVGFEADPSFNLIGRIRGPNDQYINHIMTETGGTVVLRGRGSGNVESPLGEELPQPLHLAITSDNPKSVANAKILAENLIETIRADSFQHRLPPYQVLLPTVSTVPSVSPSTSYLLRQQVPYQTSQSQNPFGGYYSSVGGVYPLSYSMTQAPVPFPPASTVVSISTQPTSTPLNPYTNMLSSSKFYGAVPPPVQLLGDSVVKADEAVDSSVEKRTYVRIRDKFLQSSAVDSTSLISAAATVSGVDLSTSGHTLPSISQAGNHAMPIPYASSPQNVPHPLNGASPAQPIASQAPQPSQVIMPGQSFFPLVSQPFASNQMQASGIASYVGYNGVYPEVTPLQQVAQALQRPPLPVSVKPPTNSALLATLTKAQSSSLQDKYAEKQPAQRRKFQEFPVGGKDSSGEEQQQGRRATVSSGYESATLSQDLIPPGKSMPPPVPRSMPMLPPKPRKPISPAMPSTSSSSMLPNSSLSPPLSTGSKQHVAQPGTGLKLVEYGEEEEESPTGHQSGPFSNGKPFWAA